MVITLLHVFFLGCLFAYLFQKQFSIFVKTNSRRKSWREIPGPKFDSIVFQFHLGIPVFIYTYVAYIIYTCIRSINIQYIICIIFAGIDLYIYIYIWYPPPQDQYFRTIYCYLRYFVDFFLCLNMCFFLASILYFQKVV